MMHALITLALALIALAATATTVRAQTPPPCGGNFERYLAGYTVAREEIDHVFLLAVELVACKKDLDRHDDEAHRLVTAMIQHRTRSNDRGAAIFAALCASGNRVASGQVRADGRVAISGFN